MILMVIPKIVKLSLDSDWPLVLGKLGTGGLDCVPQHACRFRHG